MRINEVLCFIRKAVQEKQEREKLVCADRQQIDKFIDYLVERYGYWRDKND